MKRIIEWLIFLVLLVVLLSVGRTRLSAFYYNQGLDYYGRSLYDQAISSLEESIKIYPSVAVTYYVLGDAYYKKKGQGDKAIDQYKKAIQIDPGYIDAYQALSRIYTDQQRYPEALLLLKQADNATRSQPAFERLINNITFEYMVDCLYQGVDLFLAGDKQSAYALLNKALRIKPDFAYANYILGYFYYADNDYNQAKVWLDKAIQIDAQFWPAHKLLGDIYFNRGDFKEAIENYKAVLNYGHKDSIVLNDLGLSLMQMEHYEEAMVYLKQAVNLNPLNINIRYSLASVLRDNKMFDEAISEYKKIINYKVDYPKVHNDLADIYKKEGKIKLAHEEYQKEIDYSKMRLLKDPDDLTELNNLAHAYNGIKKYSKAEEIIEQALRIDPNYRDAYITLAAIYKSSKKYDQALATLNKASSLSKYKDFIDEDIKHIKKLKVLSGGRPVSKIYLKNGRVFKGIITEETDKKIILYVNVGESPGLITLYRNNIERVVKPPS